MPRSAAICGAAIAVLLAPAMGRADWRSAPIVPRLDARAEKQVRTTLRRGEMRGNRRDVLAKVGDSITQSPGFLDPLGCGQWNLGGHANLRSTIRLFAARALPGRSRECGSVNSFSRDSAAALLNTPSSWPLEPGASPDSSCRPSESPLACEVRIDRPGYAVILYGANDISIGLALGGDPFPDFLRNMRAIVRASRRLGVVPVLNTLPPRTGSAEAAAMTDRFNDGLVSLAGKLHAPLINLWRALAPLPAQGLWDGLHLSVSGWPGCSMPCDPNICAPNCFGANFTRAGLAYGTDRRNLITLLTLRRLSALASPRR